MNEPEKYLIEDACYYLSPEYARSFWGRYIWIYQGKGHLRLTRDSLRLEGKKLSLDIPMDTIAAIETSDFSVVAKPMGLALIGVRYLQEGKEKTIFLVPAISGMTPMWKTNERSAAWIEAMGQIVAISPRIKRPLHNLLSPPFRRPWYSLIAPPLLK